MRLSSHWPWLADVLFLGSIVLLGFFWTYVKWQKMKYYLAQSKKLIELDDILLAAHDRLMNAIPECPAHGKCVPYAIDWVKEMVQRHANQEEETLP